MMPPAGGTFPIVQCSRPSLAVLLSSRNMEPTGGGVMLKLILSAAICGLLLMALPSLGLAQGNSQGKGKGHNKQADQDDDRDRGDKPGVRIVFSVHDRDTIRGYYQDRNSNLPPGLAKRNGNLPPGLQKHLERDGTLDRKSTRLNSSHVSESRMPSSA